MGTEMGSVVVKAKRKQPFNVKTFLATVNGGRSVSKYRKNQTVFLQGDSANLIFYIQDGQIRRTVVPWLPLSRSTLPPSCRAKLSTNRPPSPESAR
jgi:hypothetical protein